MYFSWLRVLAMITGVGSSSVTTASGGNRDLVLRMSLKACA